MTFHTVVLSWGTGTGFLTLARDPSLPLPSPQWRTAYAEQSKATQSLWGHQRGSRGGCTGWPGRARPDCRGGSQQVATARGHMHGSVSLKDALGWPDAPLEICIQRWDICNSYSWTDFFCVLLFWEKGAEWLNNAKLPNPRILWEKVLLREYQEFDETDGMTL